MQKKSETLRQREQAQKELLELKKRQQGLLPQQEETEKEFSRTPATFKEKKENFFYHHKLAFWAVVLVSAVLIFLIVDTVTQPKYDEELVIFTTERYSEDYKEALCGFLKQYSEDVDKNGKVNVTVYDCSFEKAGSGHEYEQNQRSRVQARITAGNAMLFLLDEAALEDLNENLKYTLFPEKNIIDITEIFNNYLEENGILKSDSHNGKMLLCVREIEGSTAEKRHEEQANAKAILEKVKSAIK